jgi:thiamine-phosphate pyrophosphorylase
VGSRRQLAERLAQSPPVLYGLLDTGLSPDEEIPPLAAALAEAGVELLQLRAKRHETGDFLRLARGTREALAGSGVPLLINDRVDVALMADADGAHVGAGDLAPVDARALLGPDRILGVTAHDTQELAGVDQTVADYVGYGAVFGTNTRSGAEICGPEALTAAVAASTLPVVAIGGIRPDNVEALRGSGVAAVCAAASLVSVRTSPGAVEEFLRALGDW